MAYQKNAPPFCNMISHRHVCEILIFSTFFSILFPFNKWINITHAYICLYVRMFPITDVFLSVQFEVSKYWRENVYHGIRHFGQIKKGYMKLALGLLELCLDYKTFLKIKK